MQCAIRPTLDLSGLPTSSKQCRDRYLHQVYLDAKLFQGARATRCWLRNHTLNIKPAVLQERTCCVACKPFWTLLMVLVRHMQVELSPARPARKSSEIQPGWQLADEGVLAVVATAGQHKQDSTKSAAAHKHGYHDGCSTSDPRKSHPNRHTSAPVTPESAGYHKP